MAGRSAVDWTYVLLNAACALAHALLAAWGFALSGGGLLTLDVFKEAPALYALRPTDSAADAFAAVGGECGARLWPREAQVLGLGRRCQFEWNPLLGLSVSEVFTSAAHVGYIVERRLAGNRFFRRGCHPGRWLEYSVSATTYTVTNLVGVGARNLYTVVLAFAAGALVQVCGGLAEWGYARSHDAAEELCGRGGPRPARKGATPSSPCKGHARAKRAAGQTLLASCVRLFARWQLGVGCALQAVLYFAIYHQLFAGASDGGFEKDGKSFRGFERQAFAYSVQYLFFPLVFFRHLWRLSHGRTLEGSFRKAEYQYLAAGLLTKVSMFLLLLSTLRELYEDYFEESESTADWGLVRELATWIPGLAWVAVAAGIEWLAP